MYYLRYKIGLLPISFSGPDLMFVPSHLPDTTVSHYLIEIKVKKFNTRTENYYQYQICIIFKAVLLDYKPCRIQRKCL